MSEKRRRQQDRRAKRHDARRHASSAGFQDRELAQLMDRMVAVVLRDVGEVNDALEAECWAADLVSMWSERDATGDDAIEVFLPAFVRALERKASLKALKTLRALSVVGNQRLAKRAATAADRLAARGLPEPSWGPQLGRYEPVTAELMYETAFDDGVTVFIEFAAAAAESHSIAVYIDHNLGGLVKDVFVAGPLADLRGELRSHAGNHVGLGFRELDLSEARARVEAALYMLDHTYDPPIDDDVRSLRALVEARLRLLPTGFELPDPYVELSSDERDRLLGGFLASPEGKRWRGDEDAEDAVSTAIDFGADYNHGGPLRWSPVVVEIFMTGWLPRKVAREPAFFTRVAEVLPDWVRYAGRLREVPTEPLREAIDAVGEFRQEMLESVADPEAWGPAKTFAVAAQTAGVDLADVDAMNAFIDRYNAELAS
ncbi:MAG: hypothetical protein JO168_04150 [Solirubrobacterales bacterium]|nr:hypothetical protein [Solirubrobacterales bacterium]MBV9714085.1 hypothetical protein [Solirubrobacterales bacterium]